MSVNILYLKFIFIQCDSIVKTIFFIGGNFKIKEKGGIIKQESKASSFCKESVFTHRNSLIRIKL